MSCVSPAMSVSIMHQKSFDRPTLNNTQAIIPLATGQKIGRSCGALFYPSRSTLTLGDGAINFFVLMDLRTHTLY